MCASSRLSEADILLYSYVKVASTNPQFSAAYKCLDKFTNVADFFQNMDAIFRESV